MKQLFSVLISSFISFAVSAQGEVTAVSTGNAPKAIGPYSQAIRSGSFVYTSGQIGLLPETTTLAGPDITSQTRQALNNLKAVLEAAQSDLEHVLKVTVFLKDMNDYAKVNEIYKDYFTGTKPARSAVQVARLPKDALIEIECVAIIRDKK